MSTVKKFVFFLSLLALKTQAQVTPSLVEPNAYVSAVTDKFCAKIKEYGVSNLPVEDVSVMFNGTSLGFELLGPVSFEDGFVRDIGSISLNARHFITSPGTQSIVVGGNIDFTNLELYRDLRADLTTGLKVGTVVFTSRTLSFSIRLAKEYTNDTVVPTIAFASQSGIDWDIHPDDMTTRLIRRQYLMHHSSSIASDLVVSTARGWMPLFLKFLNEIVQTIDFPEVIF